MAGTINLAFTQQFDMDGVPLSGGLLYFFSAGTTTPQSAFQDIGLTIAHPNPIVLDASGRVPMFYLADGFIKMRLTDKNGVTIIAADQLLVIGPSSGGGGGGGSSAGDVTQLMSTGDIKARYSIIAVDGFVRLNGLTIGNTGSSATERADPACLPLFTYLWPFSNITLDGFVKGADALTDWGNGRRMVLPDLRGRTIAGMDDMGATAANRLTSTYFGQSGIVLGNAGGAESRAIAAANLPTHTHNGAGTTGSENNTITHSFSGTTSGQSNDHSHTYTDRTFAASNSTSPGGNPPGGNPSAVTDTTSGVNVDHSHTFSGTTGGQNQNHQHAFSFTTGGGNGLTNTAIAVASPAMVLTFYMKM
jgi:microcystin-dependent protein